VADSENNLVREVDAAAGAGGVRRIHTVAGTTVGGYSGDGGDSTRATVNWPQQVAVDRNDNLYIADMFNNAIRMVAATPSADGTRHITTVAGGMYGPAGDGAPATLAQLHYPQGVTVDAAGNIYIADTGNGRIRKVDAITGLISTVAGTGAPPPCAPPQLKCGSNYQGDNGPAILGNLSAPTGVAVDGQGHLYIAESGDDRVRAVDLNPPGFITTLAGVGGPDGYSGDAGNAAAARLAMPLAVAVDRDGNVLIADTRNNRVRQVDVTPAADGTHHIHTVVGGAVPYFSGDGGPALTAGINLPTALAVDKAGRLYTAANFDRRVRMVVPAAEPGPDVPDGLPLALIAAATAAAGLNAARRRAGAFLNRL
jgi:sugar lactone lactonase YvrE